MRVYLRNLLVLALVVAAAATVAASKPVFWQTATLTDFLRGEVEHISIDGHGRLVLGPATELVADTNAPFLWAMVVAPDGAIYVGSGNEGKVFKIDSGKTTTFFDTTELEVHALALAPDGTLYAATSPDGRIYKIDRTGNGTPFFDPEDKYIWSLALDQAGNLYAGTGEKGMVYKITPDGKGAPFYRTKATHVITLAFEKDGQLLAGTEGPGAAVSNRRGGKSISRARLDVPGNPRDPDRSAGKHLSRSVERTADPRFEPGPQRTHRRHIVGRRRTRADSYGDDRGDGDRNRRHHGRRRGIFGNARARRAARWTRCDLPHQARWTMGHRLGIGRRVAL